MLTFSNNDKAFSTTANASPSRSDNSDNMGNVSTNTFLQKNPGLKPSKRKRRDFDTMSANEDATGTGSSCANSINITQQLIRLKLSD